LTEMTGTGAGFGFSDEARRMADEINFHISVEGNGAFYRWVAIRLSDGGSDHALYDTRAHAVTHQLTPDWCCYVQISPSGSCPRDCEPVLRFARWAHRNGYRVTDPADPQPIAPIRREDFSRLVRSGK
jgi:hypothetical protein